MSINYDGDIDILINKISKNYKYSKNSYSPFIEHMRFPKYKALIKNTKINFNFPVTILVGKNGCNKTSILQALYGSPRGTSVGDYWFSTNVDKIEEGKKSIDRHCFIYGYNHEKANKVVEVIKTRIKDVKNPDYWEPARPSKQHGMLKPTPEELSSAGNTSTTRWDLMEKNIIYCDCKEYVSAYDLFFYHFDFQKTDTQQKKQDFIRERSVKLAEVIENQYSKYDYYRKNRVEKNEKLSSEVCRIISDIMGENYSDIRIITHSFYTKSGGNKAAKTIWMKKNNKEYSEAFAGTGESRVILLVNDIYHASENSLVLIDEPEISLHPSAIYGLKKFLLEETLKKKHQMIITTHSTHIIKNLPKEAIKLMVLLEEGVDIIENVEYPEAFYEIGEKIKSEKTLFVEDRLTQWIVKHVIEKMGENHIIENLSVEFLPGGAANIIKKNIYSSSLQEQKDCYYLLDGDQKIEYSNINETILKKEWIDPETHGINTDLIPQAYNLNLQKLIDKVSGTKINFITSGNSGSRNETELIEMQKKYLRYWENNVKFLPCLTPEVGLIELVEKNFDFKDDKSGKCYFEKKAQSALSKENVTSEDIFYEQKRYVGKLGKNDELFKSIEQVVNTMFYEITHK
ncbi:ATP-dependent nuclease [Carnobacterium divergens]|uniref:ATP-dependent nuclease n=1 Tax=Carnobacterium divergens TaxID=2748 RepID=UPI0039AEAD9C